LFGMPSRTYMIKGQEDPMVQAYQRLATNIAIAFGAEAMVAETDMREVVAFEIRLAEVHVIEDKRTPKMAYNITSLAYYVKRPKTILYVLD
jgi:membrane metallo-endopeptidase-like protein 1